MAAAVSSRARRAARHQASLVDARSSGYSVAMNAAAERRARMTVRVHRSHAEQDRDDAAYWAALPVHERLAGGFTRRRGEGQVGSCGDAERRESEWVLRIACLNLRDRTRRWLGATSYTHDERDSRHRSSNSFMDES